MDEALEQRSSDQQSEKSQKSNQVGLVGGLTLLALPIIPFAVIIGLAKAIGFISGEDLDSAEDEVDL